jgi:hypothetical protein
MSPLSALHSLRQLSVHSTYGSILAGLTQLTGLSLYYRKEEALEELDHISGLTQLQCLDLHTGRYYVIHGDKIVSIFSPLKQLTSLALHTAICQEEFDALLTHAPQLTSLTCSYLHLEEDRSASPCSWKELVVRQCDLDAATLACIPTASLTRLDFGQDAVFPSPSPILDFNPELVDAHDMPQIMRRGLLNLVRCPAWQQCGPGVTVCLYGDDMPEQLNLLLAALAPLASKEVKLVINMSEAALGAPAVQQMGVTLGSSLKHLWLNTGELSEDFWPAVWAHLPGLQQLTVSDDVDGPTGAHQLAVFCSRTTRPLQLNLGRWLYEKVGAKLERQCQLWGVPHVTVTEANDI